MCSGSTKKSKKRGGSETQFPGKLHDLMEHIEREELRHIVSWVKCGTAFVVLHPDKLVGLLPRFFNQTKYRSFQRQLNMWHFTRILDGPHRGGWEHPYFIQGKRPLCQYMSRNLMNIPDQNLLMNHRYQPAAAVAACNNFGLFSPSSSSPIVTSACSSMKMASSGQQTPPLPYDTGFQTKETDELLDAATLLSNPLFEPTPIENMKPYRPFTTSTSTSTAATNMMMGNSIDDGDKKLSSFGGRNFHFVDESVSEPSTGENSDGGQDAFLQQLLMPSATNQNYSISTTGTTSTAVTEIDANEGKSPFEIGAARLLARANIIPNCNGFELDDASFFGSTNDSPLPSSRSRALNLPATTTMKSEPIRGDLGFMLPATGIPNIESNINSNNSNSNAFFANRDEPQPPQQRQRHPWEELTVKQKVERAQLLKMLNIRGNRNSVSINNSINNSDENNNNNNAAIRFK